MNIQLKYNILFALFLIPVFALGQKINNNGVEIVVGENTELVATTIDNNNSGEISVEGTLTSQNIFYNYSGATVTLDGGVLNIQDWDNNVVDGLTTTANGGTVNFVSGGLFNNNYIFGSIATHFPDVNVDNSDGTLLMGNDAIIDNLNFIDGDFSLNDYDLTITGSITNYGENNHIVTNGVGKLILPVGTTPVEFPVGTENGVYTPTNLQSGATDNYGLSVYDNVYDNGEPTGGTQIDENVVNLTWNLTYEGATSATPVDLTVQWDGDDEASLFDRSSCGIGYYNTDQWEPKQIAGQAQGADPYTRTLEDIDYFGAFAVGDVTSGLAIIPTATWTGDMNYVWLNEANWMGGNLPAYSESEPEDGDAIIPDVSPNPFPLIQESDGLVEVNNLTIEENAMLSVNPEAALTVHGALTNAGTLELLSPEASDPNGLSGSLITKGSITNTGSMKAYRFLQRNVHLISKPISESMSASEFDGTIKQYDNSQNYFATTLSTLDLDPLDGYQNNAGEDYTAEFNGTFHTGDFSRDFYSEYQWDKILVANPYPSALNWNDIYNDVSYSNLTEWIVLVKLDGSYGYYSAETGEIIGGINSDGNIPAMQAFFVYGNSTGNASISYINDDHRTHTTSANNEFYKNSPKTTPSIDYCRLMAKGAGTKNSEMLVVFHPDAGPNRDMHDAPKYFESDNRGQLYTTSADNVDLAINSIGTFDEKRIVPLNFLATQPGQYTITGKDISLRSGYEAYLEDVMTKEITNLNNSTYDFQSRPGDRIDRFMLHFSQSNQTTGIRNAASDKGLVDIYAMQKTVYVKTNTAQPFRVMVFDMLGQKLIDKNINETGISTISLDKYANGTYVVKTLNKNQSITKSVFINY